MNLRTYIDSHPLNQRRTIREHLANIAEVTEPAVRHWANGTRRIPPKRALLIERVLSGKVTLHDLRPDIWPKAYHVSDYPCPPIATAPPTPPRPD